MLKSHSMIPFWPHGYTQKEHLLYKPAIVQWDHSIFFFLNPKSQDTNQPTNQPANQNQPPIPRTKQFHIALIML